MPPSALTKMQEWRKNRDGKTGIAINGCGSRNNETVYEDSDISAMSNSRYRSMRKNVSSIGRSRHVKSIPSTGTRSSSNARVRSELEQAIVSRRFISIASGFQLPVGID